MNKILTLSGLALAAFLAWEAWTIKDFAARDTRPPTWDEAVQLEIALDCRQAVREGRWTDVFFVAPKPGMPPFPPAYHLAAMFAYDLSPDNPAGAALWLNWVYLAILAVSLFAIAWELGLSHKSWIASVTFCAAPIVLAMTHVRLLDLGLAAWVAAAYWAYLRSDGFFRWPASLAFGALFAVGMMHKWSFFSYLFPVYFDAFGALTYPESRKQPVAAAALALLGFMPWYMMHLPLLIPRLFQATADFAVPVWQKGAFALYFLLLPANLGPLLFGFSCVGLFFALRSRRPKDAKLLHAWFLSSYMFWAIVPNRQIRFLLPGLSGLSILACGPWPGQLLAALAGFQLFMAANYSLAKIPTWSFGPSQRIVLFPTDPPKAEEWHIQDILQTAQGSSLGDTPFYNVTLVGNHERFNGPNFTWTAKWRKFDKLRMRGVNRRLCELSRFVVVKNAELGPASVTEGLPEALKIIDDPNSWFNSGYEPIGRWSLPDKSVAVLFQLRTLAKPPFEKSNWRSLELAVGPFSAKEARVDLGRWSAVDSSYDRSTATVGKANLRGLEISKLSIDMDGLELIPAGPTPKEKPWEDVRLLKLRTLHVRSVEIAADSLKKFLEARAAGLKLESLKLDGNVVAKGEFRGVPVEAALSMRTETTPHRLVFRLDRARIRGFNIPRFLFGPLKNYAVSLDPNPETPFTIDLPGLSLKNDRLTVP